MTSLITMDFLAPVSCKLRIALFSVLGVTATLWSIYKRKKLFDIFTHFKETGLETKETESNASNEGVKSLRGLTSTLLQISGAFKKRCIVSIRDILKEEMDSLVEATRLCRAIVKSHGSCDILKSRLMTTIFYEPSTRTRCSFEAAMLRLGGSVVSISDAKQSSVGKGESIEDTIRTLSGYSDIIVMRHPEKGSLTLAKDALITANSDTLLINAGDGIGEHPTQALLDLFTMMELFPSHFNADVATHVEPLVIGFVGDLLNGRTVHSLVQLLAHYNVRLLYCSPATLSIPASIESEVKDIFKSNAYSSLGRQMYCQNLSEVLDDSDIVYVTRIQKERFSSTMEYEEVKDTYILTKELVDRHAKPTMKIMHPLPRLNEISTDLDATVHAHYFTQSENGVYVRMALLILMCS